MSDANADGWSLIARERLRESIAVKQRLLDDDERIALLVEMAGALADAVRSGKKILLFGNGGSAADAQHIAAELLGRFLLERRSFPAIALADSSAAVTAIGNDYDYADTFSRQLLGLGDEGDVAIGISTSGSSLNVLRAIEAARTKGLVTMSLTGAAGGPIADASDYCLRMPSTETPRVQECYMAVAHTLCELVESAMVDSITA